MNVRVTVESKFPFAINAPLSPRIAGVSSASAATTVPLLRSYHFPNFSRSSLYCRISKINRRRRPATPSPAVYFRRLIISPTPSPRNYRIPFVGLVVAIRHNEGRPGPDNMAWAVLPRRRREWTVAAGR